MFTRATVGPPVRTRSKEWSDRVAGRRRTATGALVPSLTSMTLWSRSGRLRYVPIGAPSAPMATSEDLAAL